MLSCIYLPFVILFSMFSNDLYVCPLIVMIISAISQFESLSFHK